VLRIVRTEVDADDEKEALQETIRTLVGTDEDITYRVQKGDSVTAGIDAFLQQNRFDLMIIGASREWTVRQMLFGAIPDVVADQVDHSVLMVRRYAPDTLAVEATEGFKQLKESVGLTTSPDTETVRAG
jgi:nucleotide-binding universal stress UspA family protein